VIEQVTFVRKSNTWSLLPFIGVDGTTASRARSLIKLSTHSLGLIDLPLVVAALGFGEEGSCFMKFPFHPPQGALGTTALLDSFQVGLGLINLLSRLYKIEKAAVD